jgi:hypothetical protein
VTKTKKPSVRLLRRFFEGRYRIAFHRAAALDTDIEAILKVARSFDGETRRRLMTDVGKLQAAQVLVRQVEEDFKELWKKYPNL